MLNLDRQISAIVEAAELRADDLTSLDGAGLGGDLLGFLNGLVEG